MAWYLIDNQDALRIFVSEIIGISNDPPSLYIDTEGYKLGRFGTLDLLQVHVLPLQETFIVDVFTLKHAAFETSFRGNSLRTLLESPSITKVFFDVRNDSDAIFSHYNISLTGVVDLQMMEYFQEGRLGRNLASLKRCIECDSGLLSEDIRQWSEVKASVLHSIQDDANLENLPSQRRPLPENLLLYAAGDVEHLPSLYQTYSQRQTQHSWQAIRSGTLQRLRQSRQPNYNPQSTQRGKGPYRIIHPISEPPFDGNNPVLARNRHMKAKPSIERHETNKDRNENSLKPQESFNKAKNAPEVVRNVEIGKNCSIIAPLHNSSLMDPPSESSAQTQEANTTALRHLPIAFVKEGHIPKRRKKGKKSPWNSSSGADDQQNHDWLLDNLDWTLCDKDCGWCGHCHSRVDIGI